VSGNAENTRAHLHERVDRRARTGARRRVIYPPKRARARACIYTCTCTRYTARARSHIESIDFSSGASGLRAICLPRREIALLAPRRFFSCLPSLFSSSSYHYSPRIARSTTMIRMMRRTPSVIISFLRLLWRRKRGKKEFSYYASSVIPAVPRVAGVYLLR